MEDHIINKNGKITISVANSKFPIKMIVSRKLLNKSDSKITIHFNDNTSLVFKK